MVDTKMQIRKLEQPVHPDKTKGEPAFVRGKQSSFDYAGSSVASATMQLVAQIYDVRDLVEMVENGRLAIPNFQRRFIWSPAQVADLLVSVARRWPIGTLLLLDGPADFAVRPLENAPELSEADLLILDGQQRMTALWQALGDRSADDVYYVDFGALRDEGELLPEHIRTARRARFEQSYPSVEARFGAGYVTVGEVASTPAFVRWSAASGDEQEEVLQVREDQLGGLVNYSVPATRLTSGIELEAMAKIFETLNRQGEPLKAFDLMVARLYPHDFNLAEEWESKREEHEPLRRFDVDGLELLRLIALRENVHSRRRSGQSRIRGIRASDVLGLGADTVRASWEWAACAYTGTLEFLGDNCGMTSPDLQPSATMLLPIALLLFNDDAGVADARASPLAERFFWAASLSQSYAQGANTQAVTDGVQLISALADPSKAPPVILDLEIDGSLLHEGRRRNESFLRAIMCLLVRNGAKNWYTGEALAGSRELLVGHAMFPRTWLSKRGVAPDLLLNFTVLPAEQDRANRRALPSEVLSGGDVDISTIESHLLPLEPLQDDDWRTFSLERFRAVLAMLEAEAQQVRSPS